MDAWDKNYFNKYDPNPEVKETFVDITHNAFGVLCRVYYNPRTKSYRFEPIDKRRMF